MLDYSKLGAFSIDRIVTSNSTFSRVSLLLKSIVVVVGVISVMIHFRDHKLICSQIFGSFHIVLITDDDMLFFTSKETLYAPITEGINAFPIEAVTNLVNSPFKSNCKVPRVAVLDLLDRLALFVTKYDKKGIYLTFTKDGIMFSSKKSSGTELIPYVASIDFSDYTCCIDIETLRNQINAQDSDTIDMYYGSDVAIKMVSNNITQIVALSEDDRVGA